MTTTTPRPTTGRKGKGRKVRLPSEQDLTPPSRTRLAAQRIDGPIVRTGDHTWLWFRLPPERWNFRGNSGRENLILQFADQLAELKGRHLHLRVTHRPEASRQWAESHHRISPAAERLPDLPGTMSFDQYLRGEQATIEHQALSTKEVFLGVLLTTRTMVDRSVQRAPRWLLRKLPALADAELSSLAGEIENVEHVLDQMGGRLASATDMDWLMTRSCALGMPVSAQRPVPADQVERDDLATYAGLAEMVQRPYDPSVTMVGTGPLAGHTRHVVVLSVGTMQPLNIPESDDPWMAKADRLGIPVEWSARFYVRPSEGVSSELTFQMDKVRAQVRHYTMDHQLPPPMRLERQAAMVSIIDDEMQSGLTARGTRVRGWWRMAVSAPTEAQALQYARMISDLYRPKIRIEHPNAQWAYAREFIPGEPVATAAFTRRGSVVWAAAAMPTVTSEVGDQRGVLLGTTVTRTLRPVAWDPWLSQLNDGSGLTALVAGLGGGKSFLGGMMIYKTLRQGAMWTVLDPSGPLARLANIPELRPHARQINLLDAAPGTLNPYRIVSNPRIEHFADEQNPAAAFDRAMTMAAATRRRLVLDTLMGLLPYEVQKMPATRMVLNRAIRSVGGEINRHPGMVLKHLRNDQSSDAEHAHNLFELLDEVGERMQLLIPEDNADPYATDRNYRLTVLTMPGLTLPRETAAPQDWDTREQESVVLLNLAAWLTQRSIYDLPMGARKGIFIDEASFLADISTGKMLMNRFSRDSRKWLLRVLLASQAPEDLMRIPAIETLLDSVFAGKLNGDQARADALQLLKVPTDQGYERVFETFPGGPTRGDAQRSQTTEADDEDKRDEPRQFLFRDSFGAVERIQADFSAPHLAHVIAALNTTPGHEKRARQTGRGAA